jgi:GT2 family glycosyltransferase
LLRICLESVTRLAPVGTQVIVVDDGSKNAAISRVAAAFPGVIVIRRERAGGFCVAANMGIAAASAPIVQLLNDDAEVTAGWAQPAMACFANDRIAAVAPLVLQNDPDRRARGLPPIIDTAGDDYDPGGFAWKRGHGQDVSRFAPQGGAVFGASGCAAFYRRSALVQVGGFPEHFRAYFEDVDLSLRLRRQGYEILHEPASVVWHRVSASYGKRPSRRVLEQQSCNEERVFWRNLRGRACFRWLPRHCAVLLGKGLRRWQEGNLLPWFFGRVRAVIGA